MRRRQIKIIFLLVERSLGAIRVCWSFPDHDIRTQWIISTPCASSNRLDFPRFFFPSIPSMKEWFFRYPWAQVIEQISGELMIK